MTYKEYDAHSAWIGKNALDSLHFNGVFLIILLVGAEYKMSRHWSLLKQCTLRFPALLMLVLILSSLGSAQASEEPRDNREFIVPASIILTVLTLPMGVNTYSAVSESPVSTSWHWSGYGIGGLTFAIGTVGLVSSLGSADTKAPFVASGFMGYGMFHMLAAYYASNIKPDSKVGILAPMMRGNYQFGLTWIKRF